MTKKKALMYFIILIVAVMVTSVCKHYFLTDPAQDFPDVCKIAIGPNCSQYLNVLVNEKKYDEFLEIQKVRIYDNKALLARFKRKISNKDLLKLDNTKVMDTLLTCADDAECKKDFYILGTIVDTVKDIVNDLISVAGVYENHYNDAATARRFLNEAISILEKNMYVSGADDTIKALSGKVDSLN